MWNKEWTHEGRAQLQREPSCPPKRYKYEPTSMDVRSGMSTSTTFAPRYIIISIEKRVGQTVIYARTEIQANPGWR
jgi:hypothetical protein